MTISDRFRYVTAWTLDDLEILTRYLDVPVSVLLGEALSPTGETDSAAPLLVTGKPSKVATPRGPMAVGPQLPFENVWAVRPA